MLADVFTNARKSGGVFDKFRDEQRYALVQTGEDQERAQHRL
jgi:hypothetical protein